MPVCSGVTFGTAGKYAVTLKVYAFALASRSVYVTEPVVVPGVSGTVSTGQSTTLPAWPGPSIEQWKLASGLSAE